MLLSTAVAIPTSVTRLIRVGEDLESVGRFREAALVYEDITNKLMENGLTNSSGRNDGESRSHTGLAYKRAGMMEEAEQAYLGALKSDLKRHGRAGRAGMRVWDVNDGYALWTNVLVFYSSIAEPDMRARGTCDPETAIPLTVLVSLLKAAGFVPLPQLRPLFEFHAQASAGVSTSRIDAVQRSGN